MSEDKEVRLVNFSVSPRMAPKSRGVSSGVTKPRAMSPVLVPKSRTGTVVKPRAMTVFKPRPKTSPARHNLLSPVITSERQVVLDRFVSLMPNRASPDPVGFAIQAHSTRWAKRQPWRWSFVDPVPVDSPELLQGIFRYRIRPSDLGQGISLRHERRRALGIEDDDEEDGVRRRRVEDVTQVRIPQFRLLLPSRYRAPSRCCPHCERHHVSSFLRPAAPPFQSSAL